MLKLRELRIGRRLTQQEVADALDLERSLYVRYENGSRVPPLENLTKLAEFFGVSIDELAGRDVEPGQDQDEAWELRERLRRDPDMRVLFSAAQKASPEHLRAAAAMLKALEDTQE